MRDGVVAAIEAVQGTNAALRRGARLCGGLEVSSRQARTGLRFNRPANEPNAIVLLDEIGASMISVAAGLTLVLERETPSNWPSAQESRSTAMAEIAAAVVSAGRFSAFHAAKYLATPVCA